MPTTVLDLRRFKREGQRFVMLTCYDYQCARIFDEVGIPLIFIGEVKTSEVNTATSGLPEASRWSSTSQRGHTLPPS